MIKADQHIHTRYCGHAKGEIVDFVRAALQIGMHRICFTDHLYRYYLSPEDRKAHWDWGIPEQAMDQYVNDILKAQKEYPEIEIRIGIEADYVEGREAELEKALSSYPFDYVIASIHCLPELGWEHIVEYKALSSLEMFERYYGALAKAGATGLFGGLGHPDFVWRYFRWPVEESDRAWCVAEDFLSKIAGHKEVCIEANSNAVIWMQDKTGEEKNLFEKFFKEVAKKKIPVIMGSDAHRPLLIANAFGEMIELLSAAGIKEAALFDKRKMKKVKIT